MPELEQGPDHLIQFPDGWMTSDVTRRDVIVNGRDGVLVAVTLDDGTRLAAMTFPGGARYIRSTPNALEERYAGQPPSSTLHDTITEAWRMVVGEFVEARRSEGGATT